MAEETKSAAGKSEMVSTLKTAAFWVIVIAVGVMVGGLLSHYVATKFPVAAPAPTAG